MGPPTDPGPSGSARVSKWSVRPWWLYTSDMKYEQSISNYSSTKCNFCLLLHSSAISMNHVW
ncbi:unnamed protein product [Staurois parvus]|uniref:Uncharacterized protein n=1 Tax=Staurois parvus TaxID=386267 RepID=A0ABN9AMH9_9NEOB|nr:unnamed protein product [Staurois parvus]